MGRGVHKGFITFEELNKSLGKRNLSTENLEEAFIHILNDKVVLVEKKSDFKVLRKKDSSSKEEGKTVTSKEMYVFSSIVMLLGFLYVFSLNFNKPAYFNDCGSYPLTEPAVSPRMKYLPANT